MLSDDLSVTYMLGSSAVAPSDVALARVPPAGLEFPGLLVYPNGVNSQVNLTEKGGNIKQIATDFFLLPCFSLRSQHNINNLLGDSDGEVLKKMHLYANEMLPLLKILFPIITEQRNIKT